MYSTERMMEQYGEMFVRQLEVELGYKREAEEATARLYAEAQNSTLKDSLASNTTVGQRYMAAQWKSAYDGVMTFVSRFLDKKGGTKASYVLLLKELERIYTPEGRPKLVQLLTITTFSMLLNNILKNHTSLSECAQAIATELYDEVRTQAFLSITKHAGAIEKGIKERVASSYKRAYIRSCMRSEGFTYQRWDREQELTLAASLIQTILVATSYFETVVCNGLTVIQPTQEFLSGWQHSTEWLAANSYKYCPCVIPPRNWENNNEGGYYGELAESVTLLRLHGHKDVFAKNYIKKLGQLELTKVRKAVNAVQATPWIINNQVLKVLKVVVDRGGGVAGIPYTNEPPKPCVLSENPTAEEIASYKKKMIGFYKLETRRKSILLRVLSHLRTAEKFREYERIYFPCNMDFRGRIYPIPSFNFQGDDVNKSLILFADVPPCGSDDCYDWMLVEGANLAGVDKVSYDDRKQWVLDNAKQILDVANDPLGNMWWADQDSPCQFLAWCFEYKRMTEWMAKHGTIIGFQTGINVAFDGTCSGLQHFSAILRDPVGAQAVNLLPGDKPNDIYGIVAAKVNKQLEQDIINGTSDEMAVDSKGNEYTKHGTRSLSSVWLAYGVTRKVTKRSVMTLAYGSKEYGFRDQILEDTIKNDINEKGEKSVFYSCAFQAAGYLAKLIWQAVNTTVIAAVKGMKWLQDCARKVTKSHQVVSWTTPVGLPVQQAYMETKSIKIFTRCAGKQLRIYDNKVTGEIDNRKQASGVAPNFIHSMDAAHLQLTICNCCDKGIHHFAMIHDSYGAPLAQAQLMYDIVRQSFIQMYTENDVFENFRNDIAALADSEVSKPPKKGTLDINLVLKSKYIFS